MITIHLSDGTAVVVRDNTGPYNDTGNILDDLAEGKPVYIRFPPEENKGDGVLIMPGHVVKVFAD